MKTIQKELLFQTIKTRKKESHKGHYGRIACIGGHDRMGGAIIMAAKAAVYTGAGMLTTVTAASNKAALHSQLAEAMWMDLYNPSQVSQLISSVDVILIGPGLSRGKREEALFLDVLKQAQAGQRLIIDADGLFFLSQHKNLLKNIPSQVILTPHAGEWHRLTGLDLKDDNIKHQKASQDLQASVVLKGPHSRLFHQDDIWFNPTGNPSQATAGMGDTLAGMLAGFACQFSPLSHALASALFLHSYIADDLAQKQYVTLPSHISEHIPFYMKQFEQGTL